MQNQKEDNILKFLVTLNRVIHAEYSPNYNFCKDIVKDIVFNISNKIIEFDVAAYTPTHDSFSSFVSNRNLLHSHQAEEAQFNTLLNDLPLKGRFELNMDPSLLSDNQLNDFIKYPNNDIRAPILTSYNSKLKRINSANTQFFSTTDKIVLNHVQIASQHVYNLCGYHVAHTLVFFTKIFKLSSIMLQDEEEKAAIQRIIDSTKQKLNCSVSFWQFHINMT